MNTKFNISRRPFLFPANNNAGGGGGTANIYYENFVFVNPQGDNATGERNNFGKPYATLDGAKAVALPGDTIYVLGGTYSQTTNLYVPDVKWHFIDCTVNYFGPNNLGMFDDLGGNANIIVYGNAIFNQGTFGQFIRINGSDTQIYFECQSITTIGFQTMLLFGGSGIFNVEEFIKNNILNRTIQLGGNASYLINCPLIECNSFAGGNNGAIYLQPKPGNIPYSGNTTINANKISTGSTFNNGATIQFALMPVDIGKVTINVTDGIYNNRSTTTDTVNNRATIQQYSSTLIINGNIYANNTIAVEFLVNTQKWFTHNGNATNNGVYRLIQTGNDTGFYASNQVTASFNGIYDSSNPQTVRLGGSLSKYRFNGSYYNDDPNVGQKEVIFLLNNLNLLILDTAKLVFRQTLTDALSINTQGNIKDYVINHSGSSNANENNVNNLVPAIPFIVDTDIQ